MAKPHPQDTILVRNIDEDCSETTHDVIPTYYKETDEETKEVYQRFGEKATEFNHAEGFVVRWAGQNFSIKPGATRLMPRFLAEHYAKHLADHILGKREIAEKKSGYITSAIERPKVLAQVLLDLVQRFESDAPDDEGLKALDQVEQANAVPLDLGNGETTRVSGKATELRDIDAGTVTDKATGVLTKEEPSLEEVLAAAGEAPPTEARPLPTRPELIKEAHALGIKVAATDTREILANKIKAF